MRTVKVKVYSDECKLTLKTGGTIEGEEATKAALHSLCRSIGPFYYTIKVKGHKSEVYIGKMQNGKPILIKDK